MFKFDNLVGVLLNEEGKAKRKKYENVGLRASSIALFIVLLLSLSMSTEMFTNFNILQLLDISWFSITSYVVVPFIVSFTVGCYFDNRSRYFLIKKYGKVIEYSVEMRIEDEGIYVTYLNDNLEIFFRREDLYIGITDEPKSVRKYLNLKDKSFIELCMDDYEIKIPMRLGAEFYGTVLDRYPEHSPDGEDDED